jgi:Amt family ammonium transporter
MEFSVEMKYVLDSFWLLISGCLVMWMAAGFAMLEAGLVRSKNTTAILTKNITLYALACVAYYYVGYNLMYGSGNDFVGSGFMMSGISAEGHSLLSDFFFQVVFVATAASIVSGTVEDQVLALHGIHPCFDCGHLSNTGTLVLGWNESGRSD